MFWFEMWHPGKGKEEQEDIRLSTEGDYEGEAEKSL